MELIISRDEFYEPDGMVSYIKFVYEPLEKSFPPYVRIEVLGENSYIDALQAINANINSRILVYKLKYTEFKFVAIHNTDGLKTISTSVARSYEDDRIKCINNFGKCYCSVIRNLKLNPIDCMIPHHIIYSEENGNKLIRLFDQYGQVISTKSPYEPCFPISHDFS